MESRVYGYIRVSSREQHLDRQRAALLDFGVPVDNIIEDKCSGKDTDRLGYQFLKQKQLRSGDTLVVKELDRLSRNKADIKRELEYFSSKGIRVKILDIPTTLDDFPEEQSLVLNMVNNILIEVLGSIAEAERRKIKQRQREGIEAARRKQVKFGRPRAKKPECWDAVMARVSCGEIRPVDAMAELHLTHSQYYHYCKLFGFRKVKQEKS